MRQLHNHCYHTNVKTTLPYIVSVHTKQAPRSMHIHVYEGSSTTDSCWHEQSQLGGNLNNHSTAPSHHAGLTKHTSANCCSACTTCVWEDGTVSRCGTALSLSQLRTSLPLSTFPAMRHEVSTACGMCACVCVECIFVWNVCVHVVCVRICVCVCCVCVTSVCLCGV